MLAALLVRTKLERQRSLKSTAECFSRTGTIASHHESSTYSPSATHKRGLLLPVAPAVARASIFQSRISLNEQADFIFGTAEYLSGIFVFERIGAGLCYIRGVRLSSFG